MPALATVLGLFESRLVASTAPVLKQWTPAQSLRLAILIGVFIVAVLALGIILLVVRRKMLQAENEFAGARSLMDELRDMRDRGDLTEAEYEAARKTLAAKVASRVKTDIAAQPPASYGVKLPRSAMPKKMEPPPAARMAPPGYDLTGEPLPRPPEPPHSSQPDARLGEAGNPGGQSQ